MSQRYASSSVFVGALLFVVACPPGAAFGKADKPGSTPAERETSDEKAPRSSEANRAQSYFSILASYGVYSFLVPGKKGFQATYIHDRDWSFQADYFAGDIGLKKFGLNLLSFGERLVTVDARRYLGNSFNLLLGIGERQYEMEFGSEVLQHLPVEERTRFDVFSMRRTILDVGVGNRWQWDNGVTLGCDWVTLAYPVGPTRTTSDISEELEDEDTRESYDKLVTVLKHLPTYTVLKLNLGYTF